MYKLHPGEDEYLTRTKLVFVNWAQIEILHSAPIRCAIGDQSGNLQDLATLPYRVVRPQALGRSFRNASQAAVRGRVIDLDLLLGLPIPPIFAVR